MKPTDALLSAVAIGAGLCFAALTVLTLGWLQPEGLAPFDSRLAGYSPEDARSYLAALPPEARALYLGPFRMLDTLFPVLLAATLAGLTWRLSEARHTLLRAALMLLPLDYLAADLAENAKVAQILAFGPEAPDLLIAVASRLTQFKWGALALSLVALAVLWLLRRTSPPKVAA